MCRTAARLSSWPGDLPQRCVQDLLRGCRRLKSGRCCRRPGQPPGGVARESQVPLRFIPIQIDSDHQPLEQLPGSPGAARLFLCPWMGRVWCE
jgi:hypothetical protein